MSAQTVTDGLFYLIWCIKTFTKLCLLILLCFSLISQLIGMTHVPLPTRNVKTAPQPLVLAPEQNVILGLYVNCCVLPAKNFQQTTIYYNTIQWRVIKAVAFQLLHISHNFLLGLYNRAAKHWAKGPSIKYVTLFFHEFWPPAPVTLYHTSRNPSL